MPYLPVGRGKEFECRLTITEPTLQFPLQPDGRSPVTEGKRQHIPSNGMAVFHTCKLFGGGHKKRSDALLQDLLHRSLRMDWICGTGTSRPCQKAFIMLWYLIICRCTPSIPGKILTLDNLTQIPEIQVLLCIVSFQETIIQPKAMIILYIRVQYALLWQHSFVLSLFILGWKTDRRCRNKKKLLDISKNANYWHKSLIYSPFCEGGGFFIIKNEPVLFGPLDNNTYFCPVTYGFLERNHIISVGQLTIPNLHKNTSYTESLQPLLFALQDLVSRCSGILAHGTAVPKRHLSARRWK